jgi:hypothetical protein
MNFVETIPKASFSLKYNDISTSDVVGNYPITNQVGQINATRTQAIWYSINLENIVGPEVYEKYELFNLRLNTVSYQQQAAFGVAPFDRLVYFSFSGPNWENNSYSITRKTLIAGAVLGVQNFIENKAHTDVYDNSFICTLRKQKTFDMQVQLLTLDGNAPTLNAGTLFPRISFFFDVLPVA